MHRFVNGRIIETGGKFCEMKLYSYLDFMRIVTVPEPCAMKLSQMTTVEGGHYCASCSRVVIDFSTKSNEEIVELLFTRRAQNLRRISSLTGHPAAKEISPGPHCCCARSFIGRVTVPWL